MAVSAKASQYTAYFVLLALAAAAAVIGYQTANPGLVTFRRAVSSWRAGHEDEAVALYRRAIDQGAATVAVRLRLAEALLSMGRPDEAAQVVAALARSKGRVPWERVMELAGRMDAAGAPEAARTALEPLAGRRSDLVEPVLYLAGLFRRANEFERAVALYQAVLKEAPAHRRAGLELAETFVWQGNLAAAAKHLQHMASARPNDRSIRLLLARVLSWQGRTDEAIRQYRIALEEEAP